MRAALANCGPDVGGMASGGGGRCICSHCLKTDSSLEIMPEKAARAAGSSGAGTGGRKRRMGFYSLITLEGWIQVPSFDVVRSSVRR